MDNGELNAEGLQKFWCRQYPYLLSQCLPFPRGLTAISVCLHREIRASQHPVGEFSYIIFTFLFIVQQLNRFGHSCHKVVQVKEHTRRIVSRLLLNNLTNFFRSSRGSSPTEISSAVSNSSSSCA